MLENILQMSRLQSGASAPNRQWHVLEEIVGSALHRTRRELENHPVEVRLAANLPLIHVDGLLLEQVFVNLLENAARYTPEGTRVTITAIPEGKWLAVSVADDGPGLAAGTEDRIFEKFYRASPIADSGRGSGLGLAICRAVAEAHGGRVALVDSPAPGAHFRIELPLWAQPDPAPGDAARGARP